jgi:hypothetical protein
MVSSRVKLAIPCAIAVTALTLTASPGLAAEPATSASPATAATVMDATQHERDLIEMRTPKGKMFYTINSDEAENAEAKHGFTYSNEAKGLGLYDKAIPGTVAVHRLALVDQGAYILVSNERELKKLREDTTDKWNFKYEGVVGYILTAPAEGTVALHRYSKDGGGWRAARALRADLLAAGYKDDGLLGFAPTTN